MPRDPQREKTTQLLADAQRLIEDVDVALERGRRLLAARGLTADQARARVEAMDPATRQEMQRRVEEGIREVAERARVAAAHSSFTPTQASRPLRRTRNLV